MKRNIAFGIAFIVCLLSFISADTSTGVQFRSGSWSDAKHDARNENKMIFVLVGTRHCSVTSKMREEVFTDEQVGSFFNEHFVNYWMDADQSVNNLRANVWGVKEVPTYIFLDQNQHVVYKSAGFASPDRIVEEAQKALAKGE